MHLISISNHFLFKCLTEIFCIMTVFTNNYIEKHFVAKNDLTIRFIHSLLFLIC